MYDFTHNRQISCQNYLGITEKFQAMKELEINKLQTEDDQMSGVIKQTKSLDTLE